MLEKKRLDKSASIIEELEIQLEGDVKVTASMLTSHIKTIANIIKDVIGPENPNQNQELSNLALRISHGLNKIAELTET